MANIRGFCFTDESVNTSLLKADLEAEQSNATQESANVVVLRFIQSQAYQKLYQSERQSFSDRWPIATAALSEMDQWYNNLPPHVPDHFKNKFLGEIQYYKVLFMSCSTWLDNLSGHGRKSLLQSALEYSSIMSQLCLDLDNIWLFTHADLLQASIISGRFYSLASLLSWERSRYRQEPMSASTANYDAILSNLEINQCKENLSRILKVLGSKFGDMEPFNAHQRRSLSLAPV